MADRTAFMFEGGCYAGREYLSELPPDDPKCWIDPRSDAGGGHVAVVYDSLFSDLSVGFEEV